MGKNHSHVLLVEIMIAVLFFMLSAVVLVQVFAGARNITVRSDAETRALSEAQNVADVICAAPDPEAQMEEMGFSAAHGVWTRDDGDYSLYVRGAFVPTEAGALWQGEVTAYYKKRGEDSIRKDEALFTLPCVTYRGAES